jgi:hypothetical protein
MYIYSFSQEYTKFQVIKAMHDFSAPDRDFIFSVMQQNNPHLKREALLVLSRDPVALEEVVRKLLYAPNPLGLRNKVILEHMGIIEELGLQKASAYLKVLSSTPEIYFWYSPVRRKAKQILEKWYAG